MVAGVGERDRDFVAAANQAPVSSSKAMKLAFECAAWR
jgi:hypothetical protein